MKILIPLYFLLGLQAVCTLKSELDQEWEKYKIEFNKSYETPFEEEERRLIWENNLEFITNHNEEAEEGLHSFTLGINPFTDMSVKMFAGTHTVLSYERVEDDTDVSSNDTFGFTRNDELPSSVDWREKNVVTPVKDQMRCNSDWVFATVGALESQHALKTGELVSLSEQNVLDCNIYPRFGCDLGNPKIAFVYIEKNHGIDTEESYPYEGVRNRCRYDPEQRGATMSHHKYVKPPKSEIALQRAVATIGPITGLMYARYSKELYLYREGIYDSPDCLGKTPDHNVLLVGYGTQDGKDYWLIKNSWGKQWGVEGYLYLARNKDMCGISSEGIYPVI